MTAGDQLGPYHIESLIGAGGMGAVWKARDTRLDRTVAIKFIEGRFSERFEREAKTIASLNHPHICTLFDVGDGLARDAMSVAMPFPSVGAVSDSGTDRRRWHWVNRKSSRVPPSLHGCHFVYAAFLPNRAFIRVGGRTIEHFPPEGMPRTAPTGPSQASLALTWRVVVNSVIRRAAFSGTGAASYRTCIFRVRSLRNLCGRVPAAAK